MLVFCIYTRFLAGFDVKDKCVFILFYLIKEYLCGLKKNRCFKVSYEFKFV